MQHWREDCRLNVVLLGGNMRRALRVILGFRFDWHVVVVSAGPEKGDNRVAPVESACGGAADAKRRRPDVVPVHGGGSDADGVR